MSRRGWASFVAMSVIWGLPYLLIKVAVGGVPVPVLVLARVGVGAALLLPIAVRRRQLAAIRPVWPWLALFALVEIILPWFALSEAERRISSSLSGLLIASVPIIIAVLSLFVSGGDRLSPIRWAGLLIGLGGVALLAGPNLVGPSASGGVARSVAEVLFVLAALNWPSAVPSVNVLLSIGGLAVVCTAGAFLIFFRLIAEAGPARASVITYINPAIAVSLGVVVLGEHVTPTMLAAFGTILIGSVLATRPTRRAPAESAAEVPRPAPGPEPVRAAAADSP